jgi:hypothetical protein
MKDKEKQIEIKKLVNIITKTYPNKYNIEYPAKAIRLANELLELYQPKLEDSVVLAKENYDKLCHLAYFGYDDIKEQASKETAEKIFNKIKIKALTEDMAEDRPQTLYRFTSFDIMKMAREIVEEFGVVFENGHTTIKE